MQKRYGDIIFVMIKICALFYQICRILIRQKFTIDVDYIKISRLYKDNEIRFYVFENTKNLVKNVISLN